MMSGIVIGLIIGVGISIGLVMYLNKFPTDFSNLRKLDRNTGNVADSPLELLDPGSRLISPTPGNVASAPPLTSSLTDRLCRPEPVEVWFQTP